ncbi:MAG: hypothetical protein JWM27_2343 [Gemmatimonadetes bacterium]|nr:hypothetical protein [Gemmatimonadota bacterium]
MSRACLPAVPFTIEELEPGSTADAAFAELAPGAATVPADARRLLAHDGGRPLARLSVVTVDGLASLSGRTGMVGHYEGGDSDAGVALLRHACALLRADGAARVIGPMDGSTWARYRFVLPPEPGDGPAEAPFLGEPWNPPSYPAHFLAAGFREAARYVSAVSLDPAAPDPRAPQIERRLSTDGITTRALDPARWDADLDAAYGLCSRAFAHNAFFSPISHTAFRALYDPFRGRLDPALVRLAEDASGALAAFLFAYPDPLSLSAEGRPTRCVFKTMAAAPEMRGRGLGTLLAEQVRAAAHARGYGTLIHALMRDDNESLRISRHSARVFRRYALYQWTP